MKKRMLLSACMLLLAGIILISWGVTGHRTVGKIAENHLNANARAAIRELLGSTTLADVSTWPDEVRNQPEYRHSSPWHYLNLPLGLSYAAFEKQVEGMSQENVYCALLNEEHILSDRTTAKEQKAEALKFIVHFVGDLHQPMHVSRSEDKGGNAIQVNYDGAGTNLHALWDSKLLDHQGMTYEQLAAQYDHASAEQIRQWQSDPLIKWIWESYEISTRLYSEIDAMKDHNIDDSYYQAHIAIIAERLEKAGIRLAGVLNQIFSKGLPPSAPSPVGAAAGTPGAKATPGTDGNSATTTPTTTTTATTIDIHDASAHTDEQVRVCARIYGYKALESMTLVNLGAAYPDQLLTVVLRGAARDGYTVVDGQTICVTGKVESYKGKPEIVVTDPGQIGTSEK